ncbi:MAG TPA: hypothetical protein VIY49_01740 [Bryobacteraceae bacterium]
MIKIERILETDWTQAYNVVGYIDADHAVSVEVRREKTRGEWRVGFNWAGYGSRDVRYAPRTPPRDGAAFFVGGRARA